MSVESLPEDALVPLEPVGELAPDPVSPDPYADRRRLPPDPLYHVVVLAICTGVIVLAFLMSVQEQTQVLVPVLGVPLPDLCMMRRWTGLGCPGCGMTRCFISLAHGDVRGALHYNPAGLLLFAMMAFQIPYRLVQLVRLRRGLPELRVGALGQILFGILGVLMVGQWLLRFAGISF